ncbi:MAG: hypothetical protein HY960_11075 [Ignavibacteriae bacterium]|nr:hypothetical protein [Ignavibacteriota bacterium]
MSTINYIFPSTHPRFQEYLTRFRPAFDVITQQKNSVVELRITPEVIISLDNSKWSSLIALSQHKREWLEALMLNCQFTFHKDAELTQPYKEGEWQRNPDIQSWLRNLGMTVPFSMYFLRTPEQRFISVVGAMLSSDKTIITETDQENVAQFQFTPEQLRQLDRRVGEGSVLFLHFCNGTGVNPKPAIEALLAEFQVPFNYDIVYEQFQKDLKVGFEWGIKFFDQSRNN